MRTVIHFLLTNILWITFTLTPIAEIHALDLNNIEQQTLNDLDIKLGNSKEELESNLEEIKQVIGDEKQDELKEKGEDLIADKKEELKEKTDEIKDNVNDAKEDIKEQVAQEKAKLMKRIEEEKKILTSAAKNEFIPGMGLSLFSLMAATIIGPLMAFLCIDQTSVKIYTATATYYLIKELSSWKKMKVGMMVTMKRLETVDISENKSLRENLNNGVGFARSQLDFMDAQLKLLEEGFEAIEKKSENAKIAAFGFAAAGGAALLETYVFDGGLCKGWTQNDIEDPKLKLQDLLNLVIPPAYAGNEKQLDYAGDIDKLGIVVGGLVTSAFVALIYKSYFPGAKSFLKLGGTRSALFLANSAIAMIASQKLKKASEIYLGRIKELKGLSQQLRKHLEKGATFAETLLSKLDKLGKMAEKYGIVAPKNLSDMTVTELKDFADQIETQAKDQLTNLDKDLIKDVKESLGIKTTYQAPLKFPHYISLSTFLFSLITSQAQASECYGKSGNFDFREDPSCLCRNQKTCQKLDLEPLKKDPNNFYNIFMKNFKNMADSTFFGAEKQEQQFKQNVMAIGPKIQLVNQQLKKTINQNLMKDNKKPIPFGQIENTINGANQKLLRRSYENAPEIDLKIAKIEAPIIESSPKRLLQKNQQIFSQRTNKTMNKDVLKGIQEKIKREIARLDKMPSQYQKSYQYSNDINNNKDVMIFDIISLRYLKSGRHLFQD